MTTRTNILETSTTPTSPAAEWHIRKASLSDLPWIALITWRILIETGRGDVYQFRQVLHGVMTVLTDAARGEYFLAEVDGRFAGQLKLVSSWHDLFNANVATIEHVYVHPQVRSVEDADGVRVYDRLHRHALEVCRQRDVCQGQLHVVSDNKRAQRAYEKRGMLTTGLWMTQGLGG